MAGAVGDVISGDGNNTCLDNGQKVSVPKRESGWRLKE